MPDNWCHCGSPIHDAGDTCAACTMVRLYNEAADMECDVCLECADVTPAKEATR